MTAKERLVEELGDDKLDKLFDDAELRLRRLMAEHDERTIAIMDKLFDGLMELLIPSGLPAQDNDGDDEGEDDTTRKLEDFLYPKPPKLILHSDGENADLVANDGETELPDED